MNKKNFIQVFEYQKLKFTDNNDFSKTHFDAMVKFNEKNGNKYFTPVYNGVQFNSYVGVIQIGGLTIEILPKADTHLAPDKSLWQSILLNMLKVCKQIQVDKVSETGLKRKNNSILEIYFEMYLNELQKLIQHGLIKKYRKVENNQNALRGKLMFSQNIRKNLVHKEKFYCEHQVYDKNHLIHQILLKGLLVLSDLVSSKLNDKVKRLLYIFGEYSTLEVNAKTFEKLKLDRKSNPYQRSLDIAKMLILNYSPNLNSGNQQMLTLLFDMNKLWEEYIFRILYKNYTELDIAPQNSQLFWENKKIRPDIVITKGKEKFVIDTKWKIINNDSPSDDDLKQMFTYNLHWDSTKTMLLYPKINQVDSSFGTYHYNNLGNQCKLGFINLIEGKSLKKDEEIAKEIILKLEI